MPTLNVLSSTFRLCAATALLLRVTGAASAAVIDDFTQGPVFLQATNYAGTTIMQYGLNPSAIIGGSRSVYIGSLGQATLQIGTPGAEGLFRFNAVSNFGYFTIGYGTTTPLNANLAAGGNDRFVLSVSSLTPGLSRGSFDLSVRSARGSYTYDFVLDMIALNAPGQISIPYSRFPGVDFTFVQSIELDVTRFEPTFQIALGSISTVPEPSALGLFALVLILLGVQGRRSRPAVGNG